MTGSEENHDQRNSTRIKTGETVCCQDNLSGNTSGDSSLEDDETQQKCCFPCWFGCAESRRKLIISTLVKVSLHAVRHPMLYIVGIPIISFFLFVAGFKTNFILILDDGLVYAPFDAPSLKHHEWLYDPATGWPSYSYVFSFAIHAAGENVLTKESIRYVFKTIDAIKETPGYDELCSQGQYIDPFDPLNEKKTCEISSIARFWEYDIRLYDQQVQSDADLIETFSNLKFPDGKDFEVDLLFGTSDLTNVTAIFSFVFLTWNETMTEQTEKVEIDVLERMLEVRQKFNAKYDEVQLEILSSESLPNEFQRALFSDLYLIPISLLIMFMFTCSVFYRRDPVQSRSFLGIGAVITIGLSITSGFGLMFIIGIPFTNMSIVLPFLIIGVGLDDTFIITSEYFRTDPRKDIEERVQDTISSIGMSIFITTLTTSLAFILGLISKIPGIYWLCLYAFPMVIIDFIFQITLFIALLVLDQRRIEANRRDICICFSVKKDENSMEDNESSQTDQIEDVCSAKTKAVSDRFMIWYANKLLLPWVKVTVIILFTAYLSICAYRIKLITQKFRPVDLAPADSYARKFTEVFIESSNRLLPVEVYFRDVDQSDPFIQEQMIEYVEELAQLHEFGEDPYTCWVRDLPKYMNDELYKYFLIDKSFNEQLDFLLNIPYIQDAYGSDIVRDIDGHIVTSRCQMFTYNVDINNVQQQVSLLQNQRELTAKQPINQNSKEWAFFTYADLYLLIEFYATHIKELAYSTVAAIIAVSVVAFFLMPHWSAALFIFPLISTLYIDLLGSIQLAGINMNVITYFSLVVSVGLLVDFIMHILLRYYESKGVSREEKVRDALETMGSSILVGGLSTFLGVLPLAASSSLIIRNMYVCFLTMILLGLAYGLILLPVLLSIIGPTGFLEKKHGQNQDDQHPESNDEFVCDVNAAINNGDHLEENFSHDDQHPQSKDGFVCGLNASINNGDHLEENFSHDDQHPQSKDEFVCGVNASINNGDHLEENFSHNDQHPQSKDEVVCDVNASINKGDHLEKNFSDKKSEPFAVSYSNADRTKGIDLRASF